MVVRASVCFCKWNFIQCTGKIHQSLEFPVSEIYVFGRRNETKEKNEKQKKNETVGERVCVCVCVCE